MKPRFSSLVLPLVWCLTSVGFSTPGKVTFSTSGLPVWRLLPELSKAMGVPLNWSPQTAADVLVLRLKNVDGSEAMRRIAIADEGTWKPEGEGYRLVRTNDQARAQAHREVLQLAEAIESWDKRQAEDVAKLTAWTPADAERYAQQIQNIANTYQPGDPRVSQSFSDGPAARALKQIVPMFSPMDLASLPDDIRVVWSNKPNRSQRAFDQRVGGVIERLTGDLLTLQEAVQRRSIKNPTIDGTPYVVIPPGLASDGATPGKVILVACRSSRKATIDLNLRVANEKGLFMAVATYSISLAPGDDITAPESDRKAVFVSEDAKAIFKRNRVRDDKAELLPFELRLRLL